MIDGGALIMPVNLSEWLALINALLTAVFAGLTFFILKANRATVIAMRDQMADQNRPFVSVTVQVRMDTSVIQLLVKNVGRSPAQHLRLRLDRDFFLPSEKDLDRNLAKQFAFSQTIDSLPPLSELLFDLGVGPAIFAAGADQTAYPHTFTVSAEYEYAKSKYLEQNYIDLRPYIGTSVPRHPIVEELERVRKSIDMLTSTVRLSAAARNIQTDWDKDD